MTSWAIALIVLLALAAACLALYFIFEVFNGPDGERYQKLRMQGPFVPLSDADIEADAERSGKKGGRADAARGGNEQAARHDS